MINMRYDFLDLEWFFSFNAFVLVYDVICFLDFNVGKCWVMLRYLSEGPYCRELITCHRIVYPSDAVILLRYQQ